MSTAELYRKNLFNWVRFDSESPLSFCFEKLLAVIRNRILGEDGPLSIFLDGSVMCEDTKNGAVPLDGDDCIYRYYGGYDCEFMDTLLKWDNLLGTISVPAHTNYCDDDGQFDLPEEEISTYVENHSPLDVASHYLKWLDREALEALPDLCSDIREMADYDPFMEESETEIIILESRIIGKFLSCGTVPESVKKRLEPLIEEVTDPLQSGLYYTSLHKGVWRSALVFGIPDAYRWVYLNQLSASWFPAVVCLKEKLDYLNGIFHFYERSDDD